MEARDYIISTFDLQGLRINDYKNSEESFSAGIKDDRPEIVLPEVEQFSISPGQKSILGTLVFADIKLSYGDVSIYMDTVVADISMSKNIVKTALPGRAGTVKEYISDGDYNVSIRGILVDSEGSYPEDQVRVLRSLLTTPDALEVISPLLQLFNIYSVVIEDYSIPNVNGAINSQPFELNCISDEPLELINDDQTVG